jgi:ribosomal protein L11 methyltransferase
MKNRKHTSRTLAKKTSAARTKTGDEQIILTLETDAARADENYDWLAEAFARPVVQLTRPGHHRVWLEVYFETHIEAAIAEKICARRRGVRATKIRTTRTRDWLTFWKHHFKPQNIGTQLRICPVWSPEAARAPGRKTILVDPGLSFGTGEHFTTRFCLEMVDRVCQNSAPVSMLDIGTGSGILAIAALKLGCKRAIGTDNDGTALEQARKNARLNRTGDRLKFCVQDILTESPRTKYDLVCANILGPLLQQAAPHIARATKRHLVLSGIREMELDGVAEAYLQLGGREVGRDGDGEWGGLLFEFGKKR